MNVEVVTTTSGEYGERANVVVLVDGVPVVDGHIGGEPEDNCYFRDYAWVDRGFIELAKALGAEVTARVETAADNEDGA
ncbi:MAG TPA: hypothetical protein VFB99_24460 [Vicinamibacterales bacterium]|nr:hypothetical protein [Vicinamibacterales bacterium]